MRLKKQIIVIGIIGSLFVLSESAVAHGGGKELLAIFLKNKSGRSPKPNPFRAFRPKPLNCAAAGARRLKIEDF